MKLNINNCNQSGKTLLYAAIFYFFLFIISSFMGNEKKEINNDSYQNYPFSSRAESFVDMFRDDIDKESKIYFFLFIISETTFT
jgi:hypothetical protein